MAGLGGVIQGFAAGGPAGAGIAMIGQAVDFLQGSVKAATESERVMAILRTTVENQGTAWDTVKEGIDKTLQSMQATTRFSDEELAQALGTLVQHGMDVNEAMKALPTVMDAAVGSGKPLSDIATAVGKAFEGQDTALTRLVPAIGDLDKNMGAGATSGDKFQAALGLLNGRFGGQALSDAETFAGVQERMGNAWDQFQETVGNTVLPLLTDLMTGFMKIGTEAIGPLMEALGEVWSALFGDDVDLKGFGQFLQDVIIVNLKALATFIREDVVPVVKMIHEAFQTASEVIGPPLKTICDAVSGFIKTLTDAFQGFYNWLVGGSLWTDLWDNILSTASQMIGALLGDLGTKLFGPIKDAFTGAMQAVEDLWGKGWDVIQTAFGTVSEQIKGGITGFLDSAKTTVGTGIDNIKTSWETGWQATQTAFTTISQQVGDAVNTKFDEMKAKVQTSTGEYAPTMTAALSAMQSATNAGMDLIKGDWQGALDHAKDALSNWGTAAKGVMDGIMGGLQTAVQIGLDTIKGGWDTFTGALQSGVGTLQSALDSAGGSVQQTLDAVGDATAPATSTVTSAFTSAFNTISTAATNFWNWLTGHSLWPDMLDRMSGVTRDKLLDVASAFQRTFEIVGPATTEFFTKLVDITGAAMMQVLQMTEASLQRLQQDFTTSTATILTGLQTWFQTIGQLFMDQMMQANLTWQDAWTRIDQFAANTCAEILAGITGWYELISGKFTEGLNFISSLWQTSWMQVEIILSDIYASIQKRSIEWWNMLSGLFIQGLSGIQGMFVSTFANMASAASSYMSMIAASVANAFAQVQAAAQSLSNQLVGHSIWTDMLNKMETETNESLINILRGFGDMFKNIRSQAPIGAALQLLEGILPIQQIIAETSDLFTYGLGQQIIQGWGNVLNNFANLTRDYLETTLTIFREIFDLIKIDVETQGALINQLWIQKLTEFITNTQKNWVLTVLLTNNFWQGMLQSFNQGMQMLAEAINTGMQRIVQVFAAGFNNISASAAAMASSVMGSVAAAANAMAQLQAMRAAAITAPGPSAEAYVSPQYAALVRAATGMQTDPGEFLSVLRTGLATVHRGEVVGRPSEAGYSSVATNVTVPVNVQVDGAIVARTVERRLVQQLQTHGIGIY
jgi:uncharacterized protein YjbJ (UPF0337 family)